MIQVRNLNFTYTKKKAIHDMNFDIHKGEVFGFLGPSGAYYSKTIDNPDKLLDRVGLLPDKNVRVESFSKGMKMRLNFIRSIMHQPDLMFFDEPTSGLDPTNAHIIKDII